MLNKDNLTILLTCCFNPDGMSFTKISDKSIRLQQYYDAFDFYLKETSYKILIVDNTLFEIDSKYKANERIEYLTFDGNNYNKKIGKGYGEALLIEYAMKNSQFLKKENSIIVKITGRLKILNIEKHLREFIKIGDLNCIYSDITWNKKYAYSYFFIANSRFIEKYLIPLKNLINDEKGIYFEQILSTSIKDYIKNGYKFRVLINPIVVDGVSASTGEKYYKPNFIRIFTNKIKFLFFELLQI